MYMFLSPFCDEVENVPSFGILAYYATNFWVLLLEEVSAAINNTEFAGNASRHF